MIKKIFSIIRGIAIIMVFYYIGKLFLSLIGIKFPPAILGLVLFATALISGVIKEVWIKDAVELLMKNMAMFLLPFWGGLIVYEKLLERNALSILLVVFITTTLVIVCTGLFVEYGLKYSRLRRMRGRHD